MFAKIYDSEKLGQILITKEYNSEDDLEVVIITFEFNEILIRSTIGCTTTEQQEEIFNDTDLSKALALLENVLPESMRETIFGN